MRHRSNIIVTSIAAPNASIAALDRLHASFGFSSSLSKYKKGALVVGNEEETCAQIPGY